MKTTTGDLFTWIKAATPTDKRKIIVPTNMEIRTDGLAVMGAGVALIARDRYRGVAAEYGKMLKEFAEANGAVRVIDLGIEVLKSKIFTSHIAPVVYLPTKIHWRRDGVVELISANLTSLRELAQKTPDITYGLPMIGAGLGNVAPEQISKLIEDTLGDLSNIEVIEYRPVSKPSPEQAVPSLSTPAPRVPLYEMELEVPEVPDKIKKIVEDRKVLVVSGHRPNKLGGFSPQVRQHTRAITGAILDSFKPEVVIHGGALGVDRAFAEMAEERGIVVIHADACKNMESRWNESDRVKHHHLAAYATGSGGAYVIVTDAEYREAGGAACMEVRNRWMMKVLAVAGEDSKFVSIHDGTEGGTNNCKKAFVREFGENARQKYLGNYWKQFESSHPMPGTLTATPNQTVPYKPQVKVA